jgi:hypothetical protein
MLNPDGVVSVIDPVGSVAAQVALPVTVATPPAIEKVNVLDDDVKFVNVGVYAVGALAQTSQTDPV